MNGEIPGWSAPAGDLLLGICRPPAVPVGSPDQQTFWNASLPWYHLSFHVTVWSGGVWVSE